MIVRYTKFPMNTGGSAILNRQVTGCTYRLPACPAGGYVTDVYSGLSVAKRDAILTKQGWQARDGIQRPFYIRDNPPDTFFW